MFILYDGLFKIFIDSYFHTKKIRFRRPCRVLILTVAIIAVITVILTDTKMPINIIPVPQSGQIKSNSKTFKTQTIENELPWWENGDSLKISNELNLYQSYNILKEIHEKEMIKEREKPKNILVNAIHSLLQYKYKNKNKKFKQKSNSIYNNYSEKMSITHLNKSSTSGAYSKWKLGDGGNNTCGYRSWLRGPGQRIVSYSLYGNNKAYSKYLDDLMIRLKVAYNGWTVRLYTDPRGREDYLRPLLKKHKHLDICDVKSLPTPLGDISEVHSACWRFAPMYDPFVDVMISRDTDAMVLDREVSAINEWLKGNTTLHVMRDHPNHGTEILAGMWGVQISSANRAKLIKLSSRMLLEGMKSQNFGYDQTILTKVLWPRLKKDMMSHDSYLCHIYPYTIPWPTKRVAGKFVGNADYKDKYRDSFLNKTCPIRCRPQNHKDWIYC